jgi:hypothetical protein
MPDGSDLVERLEAVVAELTEIKSTHDEIVELAFAVAGDDGTADDLDVLLDEDRMRRMVRLFMAAHDVLDGYCIPSKIEREWRAER